MRRFLAADRPPFVFDEMRSDEDEELDEDEEDEDDGDDSLLEAGEGDRLRFLLRSWPWAPPLFPLVRCLRISSLCLSLCW